MADKHYSERTKAFANIVRGQLAVIDRYEKPRGAWEDGTAHLFLWYDRDPQLVLSVDDSGNVTSIGSPPPEGNIAATEMLLAGVMDHTEKHPELIDDWRAGKVVLKVSTDGIAAIPAGDVLVG